MQFFAGILILVVGIIVLGLTVAYVLVPLFKGIGWLIANLFKAIGFLIAHAFEFVGGVIGDFLRLVSALIATIVLLPFAPINVILGRWSAAGHFAQSIKRECKVAGLCLYRILVRRPLKLLWLHGILEGVEQRLPEAMAAAPKAEKPGRHAGSFDGYRIVGSLPVGGSGARLYVAEPLPEKRARLGNLPDRVVIKSFALTEGSSLPQIVRESRALECAKQLGHVVDHALDEHRFYYVMPYHAGDHLGIVTRQLHAESDGRGLDSRGVQLVMSYTIDLLDTLEKYHEGGLWHKDVKPDNVIVHDGRAHLVDLGLVTPLRSAMTLTTHGTEYFRDPEMVRQALRGVKVHQVDGGRFDIYAAGAVLYFMVENTFPAHGGLSRFSKESPEALRWIVRRAMAEYNQRYATAAEMLEDLRVVAAARDPLAVRPVDLPSMSGAEGEADVVERVVRAGSPTPGPAAAQYAQHAAEAPASAAGAGPRTGRPKIRVTNWWTGAHVLDDGTGFESAAAHAGAGADADSEGFRRHSREFRQNAQALRSKVRTGAMNARLAAREQIREARSRARELQKRARSRRSHHVTAVGEREPSPFLGFLVLLFLFIVGLTGWGLYSARTSNGPGGGPLIVAAEDARPPIAISVVDGSLDEPAVRQHVQEVMARYMNEGYEVVLPEDACVYDHMTSLLRAWTGTGCPSDDALEDLLEAEGLFGVVRLDVEQEGSDGEPRVFHQLLRSEREGARERRHPTVAVAEAPSPRPFLVVNDHPAKGNPLVDLRIAHIVDAHRARGWSLIVDADLETQVRQVLPPLSGGEEPLPPRLAKLLAEKGLGGVLRIEATSGDGAAHDRIEIRRIDAGGDAAAAATRTDPS